MSMQNHVWQSIPRFAAILLATIATSNGAIAAPAITIHGPEAAVTQGKPVHLRCEIRWTGPAQSYAFLAPDLPPLAWASIQAAQWHGTLINGENVLTQRIELTPTEAGTFQVPAIHFSYIDANAVTSAPAEASAGPQSEPILPELTTESVTIQVREPWSPQVLAMIVALLVVALGTTGGGYYWRLRAQAADGTDLEPTGAAGIEVAKLAEAKRFQIEGDTYEFYRTLAQAAAPRKDLSARMEQWAEAVGFQGMKRSGEEMDHDYRQVEQALNRMKEDHET
jgi:hypothetical protein